MHKTALTFITSKLPATHFVQKEQPLDDCSVFAPVNIALVKYWGKRDVALNLPQNDSLSIGLKTLGTTTQISPSQTGQHQISLNEEIQNPASVFSKRLTDFLVAFVPQGHYLNIDTVNSIATAAGLASSASGFAALVKALDKYYQWQLPLTDLSAFARIGSGSACRSLWDGFVHWNKGSLENGSDSIGKPVHVNEKQWGNMRIGLIELSHKEKAISSTQGMKNTVDTCPLYQPWPDLAQADLQQMLQAISTFDFTLLGETAEANALAMHATMIATRPPVFYWIPSSVATMHKVWEARQAGIEVYFTMDAGSNVKLISLQCYQQDLNLIFDKVRWVTPFPASSEE
ncbi:MAG: diphosphomevalonate decarboxylase [Thiotrichaceae bacterium]